jgi:cyclopropane fatty-acyl-phospholipid synthase-like methyltransferase
MATLTLPEINQMQVVAISDLTLLQWAVENWQIEYGRSAANTSEAYRLFDEAIDSGMDADERKMWENALDICETAQAFAYHQLEEAKRDLLARTS